QEREQSMIRLAFDLQIVETMTARKRVSVEQRGGTRGAETEQRGTPLAKQIAVMQLVDGVLEVEPPQQRIRRDFRGTQDVAAAIGFYLGKRQQLPHAPVEITPHPAMHGLQQSIDSHSSHNRLMRIDRDLLGSCVPVDGIATARKPGTTFESRHSR